MQRNPKHTQPTQTQNNTDIGNNNTQNITQQITQLQTAQQKWRQIFDYNSTHKEDQRGLFIMKKILQKTTIGATT